METQPKAAYLVKNGAAHEAFEWRSIAIPDPKDNEVLIEVSSFGLNFADVLARNGLYREAPPLPSIIGYDATGTVIAIGKNVDSKWLYKRVAALTRFGAYATHVCTPITGIAEIPHEMPDVEACALGTQYATAYYSACYVQQCRKGEKVLVHAAMGGVGTALIQLLQNIGCEIYATVGSDEKKSALQKRGIKAYNYNKEDYAEKIKTALAGDKLDVSFNSIAGSTFKKDMHLLGSGGRLVLYGFAERSGKTGGKWATMKLLWSMGLLMPIFLLAKSKSIIGVNMLKVGDHRAHIIQECMEELVVLWKQGKIKPINGGVFSKEELSKAHHALETRQINGKAIISLK
jgi:NADPH2:quinone reductase